MKPGTGRSRSRMSSSARLFDDDARRCSAPGAGDLLPDAGGDMAEDERVRVGAVGDGERGAAVGGFADVEVERHLAEKLGAEALGFMAGAAMRKDLAAAAVVPSMRGIEGL
jgi:hypothetical protein